MPFQVNANSTVILLFVGTMFFMYTYKMGSQGLQGTRALLYTCSVSGTSQKGHKWLQLLQKEKQSLFLG